MNPRARPPEGWFSDGLLLPAPEGALATYIAIKAHQDGLDRHGPVAFEPGEVDP